MKKFIRVVGLFLLCCNATAFAASETERFSGAYIGAQAGLLITSVELRAEHDGLVSMQGWCAAKGSLLSFAPGAQLGWSHQFQSAWVFGVEIDYTYHVNQQTTLRCQCPETPSVADVFVFTNKMQGGLWGRLGYVLAQDWMPYVAVGGNVSELGLSYSNETGDAYSVDYGRFGWRVGAGLEWKSGDSLSFRGEYNLFGSARTDLAIPTIYTLNDPGVEAHENTLGHNLKLMASYWF